MHSASICDPHVQSVNFFYEPSFAGLFFLNKNLSPYFLEILRDYTIRAKKQSCRKIRYGWDLLSRGGGGGGGGGGLL